MGRINRLRWKIALWLLPECEGKRLAEAAAHDSWFVGQALRLKAYTDDILKGATISSLFKLIYGKQVAFSLEDSSFFLGVFNDVNPVLAKIKANSFLSGESSIRCV